MPIGSHGSCGKSGFSVQRSVVAMGTAWPVGEVIHFVDGAPVPGPDPSRGDYNSFLPFEDPDGNGWMVQEVRHRAGGS